MTIVKEHDACGIGFYANMDNKRSHDIIDKSLEMLRRLDHRAGSAQMASLVMAQVL